MSQRTSILFICMGNICRSPLAEGLFLHKINARRVASRFHVDSAGTGNWHAGERPDPRSLEVAKRRGVALPGRARQATTEDFAQFDHLICMDGVNRRHLIAMGAPEAKIRLLLSYAPECAVTDVPDPYTGDLDGFELVFSLVDRGCDGLLEALAPE